MNKKAFKDVCVEETKKKKGFATLHSAQRCASSTSDLTAFGLERKTKEAKRCDENLIDFITTVRMAAEPQGAVCASV